MARRLIEHVRRKDELQIEDCLGITLADGQIWYFPRPWLALIPGIRGKSDPEGSGDRVVGFARYVTFGDDLDLFLEAIARERDHPAEQIRHAIMLGICALERTYELTSDELGTLFTYRSGDPRSEQMIIDLINYATGKAFEQYGLEAIADPKVAAATSGSV